MPASRAATRSAAPPRAREEEEIVRFSIVLFDLHFPYSSGCLIGWPWAQHYMAHRPKLARRPRTIDNGIRPISCCDIPPFLSYNLSSSCRKRSSGRRWQPLLEVRYIFPASPMCRPILPLHKSVRNNRSTNLFKAGIKYLRF